MSTNLAPRSRHSVVAVAACTLLLAPFVAGAEESTYEVTLSGPERSGDPDGEGEATVTLNPEANRVEVRLSYSNIAQPTALHIRRGPTGSDGNVILPIVIERDAGGMLVGHRDSSKPGAVAMIAAAPEEHYLVVINDEHPVGALRGPLGE